MSILVSPPGNSYPAHQYHTMLHAKTTEDVDLETEITQDLVEALTFQRLNCAPLSPAARTHHQNRTNSPAGARRNGRRNRANDNSVSPTWPETSMSEQPSASLDSGSEKRRKRSHSMCENEDDEELAALSNTTAHQTSKHLKLRDLDDATAEYPLRNDTTPYISSDSITWMSSLSSNSINSSASSAHSLHTPRAIPAVRLATLPPHSSASRHSPPLSPYSSPRSFGPPTTHHGVAPPSVSFAPLSATLASDSRSSGQESDCVPEPGLPWDFPLSVRAIICSIRTYLSQSPSSHSRDLA